MIQRSFGPEHQGLTILRAKSWSGNCVTLTITDLVFQFPGTVWGESGEERWEEVTQTALRVRTKRDFLK